jgi:hypothetical protein
VDYDLTDSYTGYQGRLVFEPYQGIGGNVPQSTWQNWDATAGKWWGTRSTVTQNNVVVTNPCVQATPCSWSQLLTTFPNVGVHTVYGAVVLKAGSGWPGFRGNVDQLSIGVSGVTTTFDFEVTGPVIVPATPPDSLPAGFYADSNIAPKSAVWSTRFVKQALFVNFKLSSTVDARTAAVSLVNGTVVGGKHLATPGDGYYFLRVADDGTGAGIKAAVDALNALPAVIFASPEFYDVARPLYRLPNAGPGHRGAANQFIEGALFDAASQRRPVVRSRNLNTLAHFASG